MTAPLRTIGAHEVEMRSIEWLARPLLMRSSFTLLAGRKGSGKGTFTMMIAAEMTRGLMGAQRNVLIVSSEDSAAVDIAPRLTALGADLERVTIIREHVRLPDDIERLRDLATKIGNVGMIIIDPLANHVGGVNTDAEGAVRHAIQGLNELADKLECLVIGVRHVGKARQGDSDAVSKILGSTAWVDTPRAVLMIAIDDQDDMVFHVQMVAGNRAKRGSGIAFQLELVDIPGLGEPVTRCTPLGNSTKDIDELITTPKSDRAEKRNTAKDIIVRELKAGRQTMDYLKAVVVAETGASGETTWRAANELLAERRVDRRNSGPGTPWHWYLERTLSADFVTETQDPA